MTDPSEPFDRAARRRARDRAAPLFESHAFLKDEMLDELLARLATFEAPRLVLDLGSHDGRLAARLPEAEVIAADAGFRFARMAGGAMCDEDRLPFASASFDTVVSAGSLHGVNDLPGALVQIHRVLRPGGIFLAAFVAGSSLQDLRAAVLAAEAEQSGGASPRFLPMVDAREAPSLLQRAGFADPVVDVHRLTVRYGRPASLLAEARGMGESNILKARSRHPLGRREAGALMAAAASLADAEERIPVTLEVMTMTGRARSK
jgi:SAM-dependent methyltransferase